MAARSRSKSGGAKRSPKRAPHAGPTAPALPVPDQHEALAARLSEDRQKALAAALGPDENQPEAPDQRIKALHDVVHDSYAQLSSLYGELDLDPPIACKRGCIHCCYNQIALTEPEAIYLGLHLLETRTPKQLEALTAKTRAMVDGLAGKSWRQIGMQRHRLLCVFIEDGNCSVYPARPLACRGWNSVDANMCLQSNLSEDAMTLIENHPIMRLMADSIQMGLLRGSNGLGLESGFLLMARAVHLLLDGGLEQGVVDRAMDWLDGKPFFSRKLDW